MVDSYLDGKSNPCGLEGYSTHSKSPLSFPQEKNVLV